MYKTDKYKEVFDRYNQDYIFYGHRHEERIDYYKNKCFYGLDSSGCTKDNITFYYLIKIDDTITIKKINLKYDRNKFLEIFKKTSFPNKDHIALKFYGIKNAK